MAFFYLSTQKSKYDIIGSISYEVLDGILEHILRIVTEMIIKSFYFFVLS